MEKDRRRTFALAALVATAAASRLALAASSPRPFGYAWDLYHEGVLWAATHGRLPVATDCGECYHPPLYFACGAPLYAAGAALGGAAAGLKALAWFSTACAAVAAWFSVRVVRPLVRDRDLRLTATALVLVLPCLFVASFGAENDALLTALAAAFLFYLHRLHRHPARSGGRDAVLIGALAGLCALTKYSGLIAIPAALAVLAPGLLRPRRRARTARDLALVAVVAAVVCGWHYAGNLRRQRKALLGPPWDPGVFALDAAKFARNRGRYDFSSFHLGEVDALWDASKVGTLDSFPVYREVFTTLHALAWTDMSFFSVPDRHGWRLPVGYASGPETPTMIATTPANAPREAAYPLKTGQRGVAALVLRLGLVPSLLALAGLAATRARRATRPLVVYSAMSLAAYAGWLLLQPAWALKTKYILFLLPAYAAHSALGLSAAFRLDRRLGRAALALFVAALVAAEAYCWAFALG